MHVLIPARGGSKRIKNKNMELILGEPLIYYTIRDALQLTDKVYVSSDSQAILGFAESTGAIPIEREPRLAEDTTTSIAVWQDFAKNINDDYSILMQCTTPFRDVGKIKKGIEEFKARNYLTGFSAFRKKGFVHVNNNGVFIRGNKRIRTQELDHEYLVEDGGMYMYRMDQLKIAVDLFGENPFIFDGHLPIDIDTIEDLETARKYADSL